MEKSLENLVLLELREKDFQRIQQKTLEKTVVPSLTNFLDWDEDDTV